MTDLENLWDDYPTGKAPTAAILAAATKGQPKRRFVTRPLLTAAAATGLVGAFLTGTLVNDGSGGGPGTPPGAEALPSHVAFQADLPAAKSCDELLASYIDRALDLVGPYGWDGPYTFFDRGLRRNAMSGERVPLATAAQDSAMNLNKSYKAPQADLQENSDTGTNVQEAAIDEPDTAKTNGKILTLVRDDALFVYDVTGTSTKKLGRIGLPGIENAEIMLSGDTVVAVGADDNAEAPAEGRYGYGYQQPTGTRVLTISLADPEEPAITKDVSYDSALSSARQHDSTIRLVLSRGLPDFDFIEPGRGKQSDAKALKHNRKLVQDSKIEDWLPTITTDDTTQQLIDCTNVAIPSDELGLDTTSIVGFDATSPDKVDAIGLAGATGIAYESADHLYLATGAGWANGNGINALSRCIDWCDGPVFGPSNGSTYLFDFELDGQQATHVASGEVEGTIRDRWSIDEADGVLRLAVGPSQETGNFNSVVTFKRDGDELVENGRLDRLGRREEIKSVRWFDDLVIMVTFRQIDPLYAIDLSDTTKPKLLGKLKIPGFSSYLHPLGPNRMLGVGEGPTANDGWGAQIGLFSVRDVTKVRRMDVHNYGPDTYARAGLDPRAFTWLPGERIAITVLEKYTSRRVGYVSVVKLRGGKLLERMMRVEYGDDVDDVRALPMPDGRVVLVTGEDAQFFEL